MHGVFPRFIRFACFPRLTGVGCFASNCDWLIVLLAFAVPDWPERKKLNFATLVLDILRNIIIGHEVCGKPERLRLYYDIMRETETRLTRSRNPQLLSRLSFKPITKPFCFVLFFVFLSHRSN